MSTTQYRGAPPPPPPKKIYISTSQKHDDSSSESESESESEDIRPLKSSLVPPKNLSVEGRFDESTGQAMTYMDHEAIMEARFTSIEKSGFYCASMIYGWSMDGLNFLRNFKGEVGKFSLPSEETLQKCKKESARSLEAAISHSERMEHETPAVQPNKKENWAILKARMEASLLHGEHCTFWREKDLATRRPIACGTLSFGGFNSFSFQTEEKGPQYFECSTKDILSRKFCIEKTKEEEKMGKAKEMV